MFCLKCPCCKSGSLLGMGNKVPNKGIIMVNESDLLCGNSVVANVTLLKCFIKGRLLMGSLTPPIIQSPDFPPERCNIAFHSLSSLETYFRGKSLPYATTNPLSEQLFNSEFSWIFMCSFTLCEIIRLSEDEGKRKKGPFYWASSMCQAMGWDAFTEVS